jgi:hypothetical protein
VGPGPQVLPEQELEQRGLAHLARAPQGEHPVPVEGEGAPDHRVPLGLVGLVLDHVEVLVDGLDAPPPGVAPLQILRLHGQPISNLYINRLLMNNQFI